MPRRHDLDAIEAGLEIAARLAPSHSTAQGIIGEIEPGLDAFLDSLVETGDPEQVTHDAFVAGYALALADLTSDRIRVTTEHRASRWVSAN